jgi:hypothetical protein
MQLSPWQVGPAAVPPPHARPQRTSHATSTHHCSLPSPHLVTSSCVPHPNPPPTPPHPTPPLQVITDTVTAAISAPVPPGCTKKVWLCDDGGDQEKKAFMAKFGPQGGYVTGRSRKKDEMNGKSCNVNNVLKNYIFTR